MCFVGSFIIVLYSSVFLFELTMTPPESRCISSLKFQASLWLFMWLCFTKYSNFCVFFVFPLFLKIPNIISCSPFVVHVLSLQNILPATEQIPCSLDKPLTKVQSAYAPGFGRSVTFFGLFLPPANVVCEGYVFTGVCLSTGGGCLPHCILGYTSLGRHPPSRHPSPPGQTPQPPQVDTPSLGRQPPWANTPRCSACWDTVNKRAVRIPLECILILSILTVIYVPRG